MEQNKINIAKLLKDAPKGTKLYSPIFGEVIYQCVYKELIDVKTSRAITKSFYENGTFSKEGECMLFPSKDCRTWENFKAPWKHKHFESFQKILIHRPSRNNWEPDMFFKYENGYYYTFKEYAISKEDDIIPYEDNEDKLGKEVE